MRLPLLVAAIAAALLAGCATEGGYYEGPDYGYYGYGYDYGYYPDYYYGPSFFGFSFSDHDHDRDHFRGHSFRGSAPAPRASTRQASAQPHFRGGTAVAHAGRGMEHRAAVGRQSPRERPGQFASQTRTGPDREHAG